MLAIVPHALSMEKSRRGLALFGPPLKHEISMTFTSVHGTPWNSMWQLLHMWLAEIFMETLMEYSCLQHGGYEIFI